MAIAAAVLERLSGINKFCREQGALVGEGQCVSLLHAMEAMCVSLLQAVEAVAVLSLDDATTLTAGVGSSVFCASQQDRLAKAISKGRCRRRCSVWREATGHADVHLAAGLLH